jgi:hypothetical protein
MRWMQWWVDHAVLTAGWVAAQVCLAEEGGGLGRANSSHLEERLDSVRYAPLMQHLIEANSVVALASEPHSSNPGKRMEKALFP